MAKIMSAAAHLLRDMADFESQLENDLPASIEVAEGVTQLPPSQLCKNPYQARRLILDEEVEEIAESLLAKLESGEQIGMLQPITVRPDPLNSGKYQIVSGEKRWRAAEMVSMDAVPVVVKACSDRDMMIVGLVENVKRSDLSPVDMALAAKRLKHEFHLNNVDVAALLNLGKSKSAYSMTVKILALPEPILDFMNENTEHFTAKHGRVLLEQKVLEAEMEPLANKVVAQGWSARALEKYCVGLKCAPAAVGTSGFQLNQRQQSALDYLSDAFDLPVMHKQKGDKHVLTMECDGDTALNELLNRFSSLAQR
ncbi:MAG: ParB/RepB/Spo0J family partition protein [Methylococcales bacterium]|jgi:ParB/RepB/Spo0J family partition protein|nr:ParB/RepB/Spo0J family partition protein [Methylococcales bacterium]MBT7445287.1 ParB/RepB/Spo0J family partition protein [Methylococcales bacterium]